MVFETIVLVLFRNDGLQEGRSRQFVPSRHALRLPDAPADADMLPVSLPRPHA